MSKKIELGMTIKDIITGLQGVCTGKTEYLTGCTHYGFQPKAEKASTKEPAWVWIDETRVQIISTGKIKLRKRVEVTSGPMPNAPKN